MNEEYLIPISVKGIIRMGNKYLLVKNNRNEWELPGGRLEVNENPETTVIREIKEELNIDCEVLDIIDSWVYTINNLKTVLIITYLMSFKKNQINNIKISHEHEDYKLFTIDEIKSINIPNGYINSIKKTNRVKE